MAARHDRIFDDLSAKEVDEILQEKFGISLYRFARALALSIWIKTTSRYQFYTDQQVKELRKIALEMRKYFLKQYDKIESLGQAGLRRDDPDYLAVQRDEKQEEQLLKKFGINKLIAHALTEAEILEKMYFNKKRGSYVDTKSLLAVGWGNLLQKKRIKKWILLADLYYWFWARLEAFPFYRDLAPTKDIQNFLRIQFVRYEKVIFAPELPIPGDKNSPAIIYIADLLDWSGPIYFDKNWAYLDIFYYATCLFGGKVQKDWPKKFNGSWPKDRPLNKGLYDLAYKVINPDMIKHEIPKLRLIYDLFIKKGIELHLREVNPPIIIFPDNSYFSPVL